MLKELVRKVATSKQVTVKKKEDNVHRFISGALAGETKKTEGLDHRLTLRIPQWLMDKVDEKRKQRIGSISRNLWILEQLEKACKK